VSKIQTRRCISVSAAFMARLEQMEMPPLKVDRRTKATRTARPIKREGRISRTGFVEQKINEVLDAEGWPRAGGR
jgi:hypothetical protein